MLRTKVDNPGGIHGSGRALPASIGRAALTFTALGLGFLLEAPTPVVRHLALVGTVLLLRGDARTGGREGLTAFGTRGSRHKDEYTGLSGARKPILPLRETFGFVAHFVLL